MEASIRQVDFDDPLSLTPSLPWAVQPSEDLLLDRNTSAAANKDALLLDDHDLVPGDDLLSGDDFLQGDDLLVEDDPLVLGAQPESDNAAASGRFEPERMLPLGGWYRDDLRLSISYRGGGHDDPVLRSLIQMIAQLPAGDIVRQRLLASRAVSACVSCHRGATDVLPTWRSDPLIGRRSEFTKFSHKPHLSVSQLGDCIHCHRVVSQKADHQPQINLISTGGLDHEFEPLGRTACVSCHQPTAAGDACVMCHRYHVQP